MGPKIEYGEMAPGVSVGAASRYAADDSGCTIEGRGFAPNAGAACCFRTAESAVGA
jgi:hypothetical protein